MSDEICVSPDQIAAMTLGLRQRAWQIPTQFDAPEMSGESKVLKEYIEVAGMIASTLARYKELVQWDARRVDEIAQKMAGIDRKAAAQIEALAGPAGTGSVDLGPTSDLDVSFGGVSRKGPWAVSSPMRTGM